jgi:GNAT superfamily N-acetyltransferase
MICRHRREMFREASLADAHLTAMAAPFRRWLSARLMEGTYFGFVTEDAGRPIGAVGLMAIDWPPHPSHPTQDKRGYVLNLFVEPEYRARGVGRRLMEASDREFARRGLSYLILHATDAGRPLYERSGWKPTTEMAKTLTLPNNPVRRALKSAETNADRGHGESYVNNYRHDSGSERHRGGAKAVHALCRSSAL